MKVPKCFVALARWIPLSAIERFYKLPLFVPYYHIVTDEDALHVKHLFPFKNESQFRRDVDFLAKNYNPLDLSGLIDHVRHGTKIPDGSFLLTFDDGYSEIFTIVAPILEEKGLSAVFFVNTDFLDNKVLGFKNKASLIVDALTKDPSLPWDRIRGIPGFHGIAEKELPARVLSVCYRDRDKLDDIAGLLGIQFQEYLARRKPYLSSDQIRALDRRGFAIGSHSLDHPLYREIGLEDQVRQTLESVGFLRDTFHLSPAVFAFPHSDRGVTREFFGRIQDHVELTFGTADILVDPVPFNVQRINFEKSQRPAREILVRYTAKKYVYRGLNRDVLDRS